MLDVLKKVVFEDDQLILQLEAMRLDMNNQGSWFDFEINSSLDLLSVEDLTAIQSETCVLIEVDRLPLTAESLVSVS